MSVPNIKHSKKWVSSLASFVLLVSAIVFQAIPSNAADLSQFDPGLIISDDQFWDSASMSEAEVQSFLNSKVPNCRTGYTCLKDFRETTRNMDATPMCAFYQGAANELASTIITKIARACGVSPKVLLVMLQKEQGLINDTWPVESQYRSAMGAGCPDTAACDSDYYGFFNQVHYGAYLLKRYTQPAGTGPGTSWPTRFDLRYPVGQTSPILFNPNAACGTKDVNIQSQATHALYIYTPYTPNQAALAAGYGTGDGCSAYGNRNFFNYYFDWFGNPKGFAITGEYKVAYDAQGGSSGRLGRPVGNAICGLPQNGCFQSFTNGNLYLNPNSGGARVMLHTIIGGWAKSGGENGILGYPISDTSCNSGNSFCTQLFQGGQVVWNGSSSLFLMTSVQKLWNDLGAQESRLGLPTSNTVCLFRDNGCFQAFQFGYIVTSSTGGAKTLSPQVWKYWNEQGAQDGQLGFPISNPSNGTGSYQQSFQGGTINVTPSSISIQTPNNWVSTLTSGDYAKSQDSPTVYFISGRTKVPIASWNTLLALSNNVIPEIKYVKNDDLDAFVSMAPSASPLKFGKITEGDWAPGGYIKGNSSDVVYIISGSFLKPIPTWQILLQLSGGQIPRIAIVPQVMINESPKTDLVSNPTNIVRQMSSPASQAIAVGSFIKSASSPTVYITTENEIRPIDSWTNLLSIAGNSSPSIISLNDQVIESLPQLTQIFTPLQAGPLPTGSWKQGSFIKVSSSDIVYWVQGSCLRPVASWQDLENVSIGQAININLVSPGSINKSNFCKSVISDESTMPGIEQYKLGNPAVGEFVKTANSETVYLVSSTDFRPIDSWNVLTAIANNSNPTISTIPESQLSLRNISGRMTSPLSSGTPISGVWATGSFIKGTGQDTVYVIQNSQLKPISNWNTLLRIAGTNNPQINTVPQELVNSSYKGLPVY